MAQMTHIFAAWGVILLLMLVLRYRERIACVLERRRVS